MSHTPPDRYTLGKSSATGSRFVMRDMTGACVAVFQDGFHPDEFRRIVRACNSHAALVKALNTLDEVRGAIMLAEVEGGSSELAYDVERIVAQARAALEAAKS